MAKNREFPGGISKRQQLARNKYSPGFPAFFCCSSKKGQKFYNS